MAVNDRPAGGATPRVASLAVTSLLLVACGPRQVGPPTLDQSPSESAGRLEYVWSRTAYPAEGLTIHATLWDSSLVAATAVKQARREPWQSRYVEQTAFTVVVELEDREPFIDPAPLLDPDGWSFGLSLNKGDDANGTDLAAPTSIDLLLVDRFPTPSGAYHHRISMAVFFEGRLYDRASNARSATLVVAPRLPEPERGRDMLGARWARRGVALRWRLEARGS